MGTSPGPARLKLALDLSRNAGQSDRVQARATADLDSALLKGVTTITARPAVAAIQGIDLAALRSSDVGIESKLSSEQGRALLALLGLDRTVTAGDGPAQFEGSATGAWGAPLRLKAKISGTGLEAEAEGSAEPWAQEAKASLSLKVRSADFGPLLDLKPADTLAQNIGLSSRVQLTGNRLTFDDLDSSFGGSRLRGSVAVTLGEEKEIEGEIGAEQLALAPAFALALGAAGHDAAEPLGTGLAKGWRGRIAFQALRGLLPGGSELQPVSGVVKSDGQSLSFDAIKGKIGGGEVTASMDAKPGANGIALNASVQFSGVDGTALRYRNLAMPAGRASMQMTLTSQGRSASALAGALSGSGTLTLEAARISGLDPRAFEVAVRANDSGQAKDDVRLKQIVEAALAGRRACGSFRADPVHRQGRPASRRRHDAGRQWRAGHRLRRIRYRRRPGRYPRRAFPDDDDRASGDSTACRGHARRAEPQRRRCAFVVVAGGARDRSRNPKARCDRTRRAAAAGAAADRAAPTDSRFRRRAAERPEEAAAIRRRRRRRAASGGARPSQVAPLPPPIDVRPAPGSAAKPKPRAPLALTPQVANPPPRSN